jgi:hypothetical protein
MPPVDNITAKVRLRLSRTFADRHAELYGMKDILAKSQSWADFDRSFESWHKAIWREVDKETPTDVINKAVNSLGVETVPWEQTWITPAAPVVPEEERPIVVETMRQQYFMRRVLFLWAMRGTEATEPDTYNGFLNDMLMARHIRDDTFVEEIAQLKERKQPKGSGDRRLKYLLLLCWISTCLWAFTTEGMAKLLQGRYPRSQGVPYRNKTIMDAVRGLNLRRSAKPLWRGLTGSPPQLVSLR